MIAHKVWAATKQPITYRDAEEFAARGCQDPACDHTDHSGIMYLHPRCHPTADCEVSYYRGSLYISCAVCKDFVARVLIADGLGFKLPVN